MYTEVVRAGLQRTVVLYYWRVFEPVWDETNQDWTAGTQISTVHSIDQNKYPENGMYLGRWYEYATSEGGFSLYLDQQDFLGNGCTVTYDTDRYLGALVGSTIEFKLNKSSVTQYMSGQWLRYLGDPGWQYFYNAQITYDTDTVTVKAVDLIGYIRDALQAKQTFTDVDTVSDIVTSCFSNAINEVDNTVEYEIVWSDFNNISTAFLSFQPFETPERTVTISRAEILEDIAEMAGGYWYTTMNTDQQGVYKAFIRFKRRTVNSAAIGFSNMKSYNVDEYNPQNYGGYTVIPYGTDNNLDYSGKYNLINCVWESEDLPNKALVAVNSATTQTWYPGEVDIFSPIGYKFGDIVQANGYDMHVDYIRFDQSKCSIKSKSKEELVQ